MNSKIITLFLITSLLSGCGFFSNKVESIVEKAELKNKTPTIKAAKKMLYCPDENKTQFIVEDEPTMKFYSSLFKSVLENRTYSFIQRSAMYSLMELLRRPDIVTPETRLQFFLRHKGKDTYFDISPKIKDDPEAWPFIKGLEVLLKNNETSSDLSKLADVLDSTMPSSINVSPAFEQFLQEHRDSISKNEELIEVFFKGDEILTKHESFKKISLKKILSKYKEMKKNPENLYSLNEYPLKDYDLNDSSLALKANCNFDINKESVTKDDLLENKMKKNSHYFAMMEGNNIFLAVVSSFVPEKISNLKGTYFFKTAQAATPLPFCEFKTKGLDTLLFSTKGRYPAQHLRHLLTYEIGLADSQQSLQEILTFSRHLFLNNPDRILYESKRGRKAQLDFFLSMNFPIYHVSSLGDIIGASSFSTKAENSKSLLIDDRSTARLRCSF